MKLETKRYYDSTCYVFSFIPPELRLEDTPGIPGRREHISKIFGNPRLDEVTWLRVNRAYFNMSNPTSESMGDNLGDNFINAGYKEGKIYFEPYIPTGAEWSVGTSYMLLRDGKYNYDNSQYFTSIAGKNPRTFFGQGEEIKFIVVNGRRINEKGLTANEQRSVARSENLKDAANLDGGGSSVMMLGNRIVNSSYDGRGLGNIFCGYRKYNLAELPVCRVFSLGVWVHLLQRLLTSAGITCKADGSFGTATKEAVKLFQKREGLLADGIVGQKTWAKLLKYSTMK